MTGPGATPWSVRRSPGGTTSSLGCTHPAAPRPAAVPAWASWSYSTPPTLSRPGRRTPAAVTAAPTSPPPAGRFPPVGAPCQELRRTPPRTAGTGAGGRQQPDQSPCAVRRLVNRGRQPIARPRPAGPPEASDHHPTHLIHAPMARAAAPLQGRQPGRWFTDAQTSDLGVQLPAGRRRAHRTERQRQVRHSRPSADLGLHLRHRHRHRPRRQLGHAHPRPHGPAQAAPPATSSSTPTSFRQTAISPTVPLPAMRAVPGGSLLLLEDRSSRTCLSSRRSGGERTTCLGQPSGAAATPLAPQFARAD